MWLSEEQRYLSKWKYFEVGRYVESVEKLVRYQSGSKGHKKSILLEWKDVEKYCKTHGNVGVYSSVFQLNRRDVDSATRLGSLYFDLDSDDGRISQGDSQRLVEYLSTYIPESAIRVYFTGKKGFHIECEAITLGVGPSNELPGLYRYIANQLRDELSLSTVDFVVYESRRMWRIPSSRRRIQSSM